METPVGPPGKVTAPAPVRRYALLGRLWLAVLAVVALALVWLGQYALTLLALAAGYSGYMVVFDTRRSWWAPEVGEFTRNRQSRPRDRRAELVLLVAMGVVVGVVLLLTLR